MYGNLFSPVTDKDRPIIGVVALAPNEVPIRMIPRDADPGVRVYPYDFNRFDFSENEIVLLAEVGERRVVMMRTKDDVFSGYTTIPMALLFYGNNGKLTRKLPLKLPFQVKGIALFSTGRVFVAGENMLTRETRAAILNPDGSIFREFVRESKNSGDNPNAVEWLPDDGPLRLHRIGNEVLLPLTHRNPMTGSLPWPFTEDAVTVIHEDGTVRFVRLAPEGFALGGMASAGDDWVGLFYPKADLERSMKERSRLVLDNVVAIRVNPDNGLPLYRIAGMTYDELHSTCFLGENVTLFRGTTEGKESKLSRGYLVADRAK